MSFFGNSCVTMRRPFSRLPTSTWKNAPRNDAGSSASRHGVFGISVIFMSALAGLDRFGGGFRRLHLRVAIHLDTLEEPAAFGADARAFWRVHVHGDLAAAFDLMCHLAIDLPAIDIGRKPACPLFDCFRPSALETFMCL